ncbi:MAG TPA: alpha/beta hydrolase [Burkholderiaceae bacterium]|nr:alpha/beta hydrolase [Burkholderiaceae bacterium]
MPASLVNGVQVYWEISGELGAPAVLVHGSWGDHHNWAPVVPALSRSLRVATYDRRGHSRSERLAGQGSVDEDVADLAALIGQLFQGPAHVIGSSFGAVIVLRLAAARPDLFLSLIVHEPPLFGLLQDVPQAQSSLAGVRERVAAVVALLQAGDLAGGARRFVETIAFGPGAWDTLPAAARDTFVFNAPTWLDELQEPAAMTMDLGPLSSFPAPALLTVGGQSPPFFPLVVDRIAAALPGAGRRTFADAGHVPHLSHPEEYVRVATRFIQDTR